MKATLSIVFLCISQCICAQINYGTPINDQLPEKLISLRKAIEVHNFPKKIDPVRIDERYYWKHNTSIRFIESDLEIVEFGAYLYYNDMWNLRKSYTVKEFTKSFGTKQGRLKQSEPYTWVKNWRTDNRLFGGWSMWYFIGKTANGELVCGYEKIETTANLLNKE